MLHFCCRRTFESWSISSWKKVSRGEDDVVQIISHVYKSSSNSGSDRNFMVWPGGLAVIATQGVDAGFGSQVKL